MGHMTGRAVKLPFIKFVAANAASGNTLSMPTHQEGDLICAWAFVDGSTSGPTLPFGWRYAWTTAGTLCVIQTATKIAKSASETFGTFTGATEVGVTIYRKSPDEEWIQSTSGPYGNNGVSNTINAGGAPATLDDCTLSPPTFWWQRAFCHRTATNMLSVPLAGWVLRGGVATGLAMYDINQFTSGTTNSVGDDNMVVNASSGWVGVSQGFSVRRWKRGQAALLVGHNSAASTTCGMPTHQTGDLIVVQSFVDGSTTAPTNASGYTSLEASGANTCAARLSYKYAASGGESVGSWTGATGVMVHVFRNAAIGAVTTNSGTGTAMGFPALTLQQSNGTSRVLRTCGHRTWSNAESSTILTGAKYMMTEGAPAEVAGYITDYPIGTNPAAATGTANASSGWRTHSLEIKAA